MPACRHRQHQQLCPLTQLLSSLPSRASQPYPLISHQYQGHQPRGYSPDRSCRLAAPGREMATKGNDPGSAWTPRPPLTRSITGWTSTETTVLPAYPRISIPRDQARTRRARPLWRAGEWNGPGRHAQRFPGGVTRGGTVANMFEDRPTRRQPLPSTVITLPTTVRLTMRYPMKTVFPRLTLLTSSPKSITRHHRMCRRVRASIRHR